jgi:hypothetical protein
VTKKRGPSLPSGMEDVLPGEGGEPLVDAGIGGGDTISVEPMDYEYGTTEVGSTTGLQGLQLEVDILSASAIDSIAAEIARRITEASAEAKLRSIIVATPEILSSLRLHAALEAEVASLELGVKKAAESAPPKTVEVADETAFALPILAAASSIPELTQKAARVLKSFAKTTAYSGRTNRAKQVLLDAALAKHLSLGKIAVEVPERSLPSGEKRGLVHRVLKLQALCQKISASGESGPELEQAATSIDAMVAALFGAAEGRAPGGNLAQQLVLADAVSEGLRKRKGLLLSEIVFSGGSYRTRRWIFNFLFGRDGLTYSGGAGVTYFLFGPDGRSALDSDTIYFASPHGSFLQPGARLRPTNIMQPEQT